MASQVPARNKEKRAALTLRLAGASYAEIADAVGYASAADARNAVVAELASYEATDDERKQLRREEAARVERLMRSVWGKATDPNNPEHLSAVKIALQLVERHGRIYGVDMPQEVVIYNPTASEIDEWVATIIQQDESQHQVIEAAVIVDE